MLHQVQLTPSQQAAINRRNAFNAKIASTVEARKPTPKVIPIKQAEPLVVPVPVTVVWNAEQFADYQVALRFSPDSKKRRTISDIVAATAAHFEMGREEFLSKKRNAYLVTPRHIAMYIAHVHTMQPTTTIGHKIANCDHTTVIHGIRAIHSRILFRDAEVIRALDAICDLLSIEL